MEITYFGHSCFLVNIGGYRLLFDPFIRPNEKASDIKVDAIEADYILLSHAHQDHSYDAEEIARKCDIPVIGIWEIHAHYEKKELKTHPMNIGGKWPFEFGTVRMTPAVHSSSFPDGSYGGNPAGFIVESDEHTFYYAGDTALFSDMQLIGNLHKPAFAFLPIGDNFTMDIQEALIAAKWLGVNKVIGMHYDTFPYIEINQSEAKIAAGFHEVELILMKIGETISI